MGNYQVRQLYVSNSFMGLEVFKKHANATHLHSHFPYCPSCPGLYEELVSVSHTLGMQGNIVLTTSEASGTTAHATINLNRQR